MKRIAILFVLIILVVKESSAHEAIFPPPYQPEKIVGGYKYFSLCIYQYKDNSIDSSTRSDFPFRYEYDEKHRMVEETFRDLRGCYPHRYNFTYNNAGNIISALYYSSSSTSPHKTTYRYNSSGKVIEEISRDENGKLRFRICTRYKSTSQIDSIISYNSRNTITRIKYFTYYRNGYQSDEIEYSYNGWQYYTETEKFDVNGNMLQHIEYKEDGSIEWTTYYTYNANNKLTEERGYDFYGYSTGRRTYKYDTRGNTIESVRYNPDKVLDTFTFMYNFRRKAIKSILYYPGIRKNEVPLYVNPNFSESVNQPHDGAVYSKVIYNYDTKGVLREEFHSKGDKGISSRNIFSYDSDGNITGDISYDASNKPTRKTEFVYSK